MSVFRSFVFGGLALAALTAFAMPARADWHWRHGPHGWVRFWVAPGAVVAPPPVYYAPPPVYYVPPPVVYAPPPVVYAPPFGIGSGSDAHPLKTPPDASGVDGARSTAANHGTARSIPVPGMLSICRRHV